MADEPFRLNKFLGEDVSFWYELRQKAETLGSVDTIRDNARLRAKVSHYEQKIREMVSFGSLVDDLK